MTPKIAGLYLFKGDGAWQAQPCRQHERLLHQHLHRPIARDHTHSIGMPAASVTGCRGLQWTPGSDPCSHAHNAGLLEAHLRAVDVVLLHVPHHARPGLLLLGEAVHQDLAADLPLGLAPRDHIHERRLRRQTCLLWHVLPTRGAQQVQCSKEAQPSRRLLLKILKGARCFVAPLGAAIEGGLTLPAPEPPIRAVSCPGTALPLMVLSSSRRAFFPLSSFLCFPGIGTKYCRLRYTCGGAGSVLTSPSREPQKHQQGSHSQR